MNKEELKNEIRMLRDSMYREYKDTSRGPDASRWAHVRYNLWVEALKMVDQLDEPEKVIIPQFVADYLEFCKSKNKRLNVALSESPESKMVLEMGVNWEEANEIYARAWLDGYVIEKEPLYYAKIKGHELIETEPILDDDTGKDVSEWNRNIYFIQQLNKKIVIDMKDSGLRGAKHFMTIKEWAELGINEANAEFEPVEESP